MCIYIYIYLYIYIHTHYIKHIVLWISPRISDFLGVLPTRGGLDGGVSGLRLCDVRLPRNGDPGDPGDPRSHGEPLRMSYTWGFLKLVVPQNHRFQLFQY
jgi:hypothetical protein